ncbi:Pantothenate transporter liz1 [Fusarium oxysporum f. sp. albedinis]|nr:Pantothenate transporter liz1 [Fusarium oxysporum f. sp. albedinis]
MSWRQRGDHDEATHLDYSVSITFSIRRHFCSNGRNRYNKRPACLRLDQRVLERSLRHVYQIVQPEAVSSRPELVLLLVLELLL